MLSKRLAASAAICLLLGAGTAACGDNKDKAAGSAAAPSTGAAAAATPTATAPATPTPTAAAALDTDRLSAQEIQKKAKDALATATSMKIDGSFGSADGVMKINLAMDTKGQCQGTMGLPGMGSYELISDGKQYFIKPDAQFWKTFGGPKGDAVAELFKGRYLTGFQNDPKMKDLAELCDLSVASKQMLDDGRAGAPTKGSAGTVNGVKTFSLKMKDAKGQQSFLHVATEGKPYPVRVEQTTGKDAGKIDFLDFDKPLTITMPSPDNVVDYTKFQDKVKSV
ncbi:hypothetical protein [Streptomyces sp. FH025]|uniref:hypothetical protein n=1 Tax=Streptomyces sp. FH025 TaxID=2815937 RepID=UPI001A9E986F|nr:hypothetical protein [Streptomyces sp. FH025]MBO1418373.1 hypothetical protein [Streptomyces sp. FH025]